MAVFEFVAIGKNKEAHEDSGRIVARDKLEVYDKLRRRGLELVRLKRIEGLAGLISRLTADIK